MRREGEGEVALWNGQRAGGTRGGGVDGSGLYLWF